MCKWFTYGEFIKSDTAKKLNIDNTPTEEYIQDNIINLMRIMDKIRERWTDYCEDNCLQNPQIIINSGYRCEELNKAVKGSKTSAHKIGAACDFEALNGRNKELFEVVQNTLKEYEIPFDQLINENDYEWIHLGIVNMLGLSRKEVKSL